MASGRPYRLLFGGDTNFAESYAPAAAARRGYSRPLERLEPLIRRSDYAIVNLETPLTSLRAPPYPERDYVHWSDPRHAAAALRAAGIDAVGLANNHAMDFGPAGLTETLASLKSHGLAAFGGGLDLQAAGAPLLHRIRLPGGRERTLAVFGMFQHRKAYAENWGFYAGPGKGGVNTLDPGVFDVWTNALRARLDDVFVVAFVHWGKNYAWRTSGQRDLGRALIRGGADLVVGHHGHVAQEVEHYRGRWILYGIGNFMFGAPGRYASHSDTLPFGLPVDLTFSGVGAPGLRLYPILSDNRVTGYQPKPATQAQVAQVRKALQARASADTALRLGLGSDEIGAFLELA